MFTEHDKQDQSEPVIVFNTTSQGDIAIAKSMLTAANIEFSVKGDTTTGLGTLFASSEAYGGMQILVRAEDAADAREILQKLEPA